MNHPCHHDIHGKFNNTVRKQIKATFLNRFIRFSCYEGTNIIQGFIE